MFGDRNLVAFHLAILTCEVIFQDASYDLCFMQSVISMLALFHVKHEQHG